ncbi:MAG: hypothetical protein WBL64_11550 [Nitrososphaeraceae archaeon]
MHVIESLVNRILINDVIEIVLYIIGSILSAGLTVLSFYAYRNNGPKRLKYAVIAFSLFCAFLIYENIEHLFTFDNAFTDIIIPFSGLAILVFFFA